MAIDREQLRRYVDESNRIERVETKEADVISTEFFLSLPKVGIRDLWVLGQVFTPQCVLRSKLGHDVYVGDHVPQRGGEQIPILLQHLLDEIQDPSMHMGAYEAHLHYETLHPFMDGNGRTGRALYLWQSLRADDLRPLQLGFLHDWYYRSLTWGRA